MSSPVQPGRVLPFADARHAVERHARALQVSDTEALPLVNAAGRVLAEAITADRDLPPFPRATRDGFAVRSQDVAKVPARLRIVAEIKAGDSAGHAIAAGECAEIMTGAPAPPGADAVVMVEYTSRSGDMAELQRSAEPGQNIVPAGSEAKAGAELVAAGTRIRYPQVAVASAVGKSWLTVYKRPRVAVLSTGDEVVAIGRAPGPAQIRNSNSYSLSAQLEEAGAIPERLPIAPDVAARLRELIAEGLRTDLLLMTGGVSMGKYDLVEQVLAEFGAEFIFTGAEIQPGRPVVFGRAGKTYFFGLPGNPISTMVTFDLFVRPLLDALSGAPPAPLFFLQARLKSEVRTKTGLTRFLPALLTGEFEGAEVEAVHWQGSGDIAANARANCYLVVPPDREHLAAGEMVSILPR
ncbi:MAG TPA: gephyrin-like molybdotransferase Glp [Terriglobales bacterium]|nr:gephyrin-like molybdotransferase Glp [Terriglobales bacterium]